MELKALHISTFNPSTIKTNPAVLCAVALSSFWNNHESLGQAVDPRCFSSMSSTSHNVVTRQSIERCMMESFGMKLDSRSVTDGRLVTFVPLVSAPTVASFRKSSSSRLLEAISAPAWPAVAECAALPSGDSCTDSGLLSPRELSLSFSPAEYSRKLLSVNSWWLWR